MQLRGVKLRDHKIKKYKTNKLWEGVSEVYALSIFCIKVFTACIAELRLCLDNIGKQ